MNRALWGGLAGSAALSAWVLLNPAPAGNSAPASIVAASPARAPFGSSGTPSSSLTSAIAGEGTALVDTTRTLPAHWPVANIEPATRSPFIATRPPAAKPVTPVAAAPPPPAPPPPVSDYRFWGRMVVQGGQRLTYVARGVEGAPVPVEPGTRLEGGWTVESIGDNAVVLVHATTLQHSTVSIPLHTTTSP